MKSIIGNCPNGTPGEVFTWTMPDDVPTGRALFAWYVSWPCLRSISVC